MTWKGLIAHIFLAMAAFLVYCVFTPLFFLRGGIKEATRLWRGFGTY